MQSIDLFYFSATGNTRRVTTYLASALESVGIAATLINIEDVPSDASDAEPRRRESIIILYPVYGFNPPRIVEERLAAMGISRGTVVSIVFVSCDPVWLNDASALRVRRRVERLGGEVRIERNIPMPSNWAVGYPPGLRDQLDAAARRETRRLAGEILEGATRPIRVGPGARVVSFVGLGERIGDRFFGRLLKAGTSCTACGKCAASCPSGNIVMGAGRPVFGWRCLMCMRCIYSCPAGAIRSRGFSFTVLPEGYSADTAFGTGDTEGAVTPETRGLLAHLYRYVSDEEPDDGIRDEGGPES